jgi:hypothetical protein
MIRLQEALDNRFLNDGNTVQCPIVGCGGQQALKIGIEKMPAILVIETTATVNEGHTFPLSCIDDIERSLTVQGTKYALVQVILHNGSHYRGITVLDNQNVLYDGKLCDKFRSIGDTVKFASKEMDENYRVSCLWYRKVFNKKESPSNPLPVYPPFPEMTHQTHAMDYDIINENATCGMEKTQHGKGSTVDLTPKLEKRILKPRKRFSPPDQATPKPPKRRTKNKSKRVEKSPSVTGKRYHDPVGISIRQGKEFGPIPICPYCKNGIPQNRWRVINRVKRKGKGYDVKQIHIWCAKLALSDEEFELVMRLLKTSSDTEIKEHRSAWIQLMHQGMGKGAQMGATRRTSLEWFNDI